MRPFFDLGGPPGLRIDMEASEGELAQGQIVEGGRSDRARPEHKGPPSACPLVLCTGCVRGFIHSPARSPLDSSTKVLPQLSIFS